LDRPYLTRTTPTIAHHHPTAQGELPARERLCKYAREHVLLRDGELYEDDADERSGG
jgi:hypothetical protein